MKSEKKSEPKGVKLKFPSKVAPSFEQVMKQARPSDKIDSIVGVFDTHYPHHIDEGPLLQYARECKTKTVILGGDMWDLGVISHHRSKEFIHDGFNKIREEFNKEKEGFKAYLARFKKALPKAKFIYLVGNHEVWLDRFLLDYPQLETTSVEQIINEAIPDIEIVPQGGFYRIGKMLFCHGDNFGSQNPAKQAVERIANYSVFMGHHHVYQVWSHYSMADSKQKHVGVCVPTFGTLQPQYIKNRAHR